MLCPRCGNKIHANSNICVHCQYELEPDDIVDVEIVEDTSKKHNKNHTKRIRSTNTNKKEVQPKSTNYVLMYFIYLLILLPIVGVIASFIVFGLNLYSITCLIMGILIEIITAYFLYTGKKNR